MTFILVLMVALVCGAISMGIGSKKGYPHTFWWGFLLSIIGIKVVALKPYPPSDNQV